MQPIWNAIIKFDPQVFIWLGDNIYGDIRLPNKLFGKERNIGPWKNTPRFVPATEQEMKSKYEKAKSNPGYSRLRQNTKVFHPCYCDGMIREILIIAYLHSFHIVSLHLCPPCR